MGVMIISTSNEILFFDDFISVVSSMPKPTKAEMREFYRIAAEAQRLYDQGRLPQEALNDFIAIQELAEIHFNQSDGDQDDSATDEGQP
jgi:hypothetical protein